MKNLSSFTRTHIILSLYDFLVWNTKEDSSERKLLLCPCSENKKRFSAVLDPADFHCTNKNQFKHSFKYILCSTEE